MDRVSDERNYSAEAEKRWGSTPAYAEYAERDRTRTDRDRAEAEAGLNAVFARFAECMKRGSTPGSEEAQAIAAGLQEYITANFYTCTDEILAGLGKMYVSDARFGKNIDRHAPGAARFASAAIEKYLEGK